ncbi:YmfL family putative regulatory protein [Serratia rubidaea]|uniref:YmfL family putative regulatory protein n=1 Tax=Serratia rubidaea TaxID=61652 RepID=UPI001BAF8486|nr:YmfL family putative regulatory protein [Serratia rubidaea]MBS0971892.1 DNA-binding protein [Serratia rubidaea]MDC6111326.1 YmfL family putative regulatory protein [Serratia rubidaea]
MDNKDFPTQSDITDAMHRLITSFAGGYEAMAQELAHDGTHNALRNRVRQVGGQMVPIGMAIQMEQISGRTDVTEAMCKRTGGVFVKLPEVGAVDNEELLIKFNELMAALGVFAKAHNDFTADGVLDSDESKKLKAKGYRIQTLVAEIYAVTVMMFGKGDAQDMRSRASAHQFNV